MPLTAQSEASETSIDWNAYVVPEEIRELLTSARAHFASLISDDDLRQITDNGLRQLSDDQPGPAQQSAQQSAPRPALWPALAEHGYTLVGLSEELDGFGALPEVTALLEIAGEALLPAALMSHSAAAQTMQAFSTPDASLATEQHAIGVETGSRLIALDAAGAQFAVAVTQEGAGSRVRRYELGDAPRTALPAVDPTRVQLEFDLSTLAITDEQHVDADPDAVLALARCCVAADLVGVAERALQKSVAHAKTREQFGRAIGTFQGVAHQLADVHVMIERARSLTVGAAVEATRKVLSSETTRLAMLAKASAADAATRATALHVQLLGAMGLTFEADAPLGVRRARSTAPMLGTPHELYAKSASLTLKGRAQS